MDKQALVAQLRARLAEALAVSERAHEAAAEEARHGATAAEKRDDARVALEWSHLARGQARRVAQLRADLAALDGFAPGSLAPGSAAALGAVVEVEHEEGGLTFFLAPAGAGEELSGPGGDGFLTVATPASPLGRAVLGRRVGDVVEARIGGERREWTIAWVA
ncbi:MAG: transcription elongation factor GreAB [Deltaproteobacteria bacterium]|nr:transcription elongation factor GreAB [Deltaproteobacteria bacterium]